MGYMFVFIGRIARLCDPCRSRGVKLHCFQDFCMCSSFS